MIEYASKYTQDTAELERYGMQTYAYAAMSGYQITYELTQDLWDEAEIDPSDTDRLGKMLMAYSIVLRLEEVLSVPSVTLDTLESSSNGQNPFMNFDA